MHTDGDEQKAMTGRVNGMPPVPQVLSNCVFVDRLSKKAFCVKDSEPEVLRQFRNYLSLLKQGGHVEEHEYVPADKFARLKQGGPGEDEQANSDTQSMVVKLFKAAAQRKASDIHIIEHESYGEVFFRINGDLLMIKQLPKEMTQALLSVVYTSMADMKESTYKLLQPQSARIKKSQFLPDDVHSIRIERTPVVDGQLMVLRLLYKTEPIPIEDLGYSERLGQLDAIRLMQKRPHGLVIIAGPTGSGKSTSLKNILTGMKANTPEKNFTTVEDPPEYPMRGINQIPIIVDANATDEERKQRTSRTLDSILRLDPDIIMIGEIRSKIWAELGLMSASTGHLTWGTLHAVDPFGIVARLAEILGTPDALKRVAEVGILCGLIYQELVQTLCPHCKISLTGNEDQLPKGVFNRLMGHINVDEDNKICIKGPGCDKCHHTGVGNRTLLAEVVVPDHFVVDKILTQGIGSARRNWLEQNPGQSIKHHALEKIRQGLVDPIAAEKVVGPLTFDDAMKDRVLDKKEIHDLSI